MIATLRITGDYNTSYHHCAVYTESLQVRTPSLYLVINYLAQPSAIGGV